MGAFDTLLRVVSANSLPQISMEDGVKISHVLQAAITGHTLDIGIDQSTTQIGFAVRDSETRELLATMDICNLGFPDKYEFKKCFRELLRINLAGYVIKTFIYEIPVEHGGNMYVRRVLNDLLAFVGELPKFIPELRVAEMIQVNNLVWKTHYLKDPCYQGLRKRTEDVKESARMESIKRYPWTDMLVQVFTKPADSYDAVGILYGTFDEMESQALPGLRKVSKIMPIKPNIKYSYKVFVLRIEEIRETLAKYTGSTTFNLLEYNPAFDLDENCHRWVSYKRLPAALVVCSEKSQQVLKWELGLEMEPGKIPVVCVSWGEC